MLLGSWPRAHDWPSWPALRPHWLHVQRPSRDCGETVSIACAVDAVSPDGSGSGSAQPLSAAAATSRDEPTLRTVNSDCLQFMRSLTTLTMSARCPLVAATFGIGRRERPRSHSVASVASIDPLHAS